jgi:hypothetical protein
MLMLMAWTDTCANDVMMSLTEVKFTFREAESFEAKGVRYLLLVASR